MPEYIYIGVYHQLDEQLTILSTTEEYVFELFHEDALSFHIVFFITEAEMRTL